MSTADHAGRPLRSSSSAGGDGAVRRTAGEAASAQAPTAPVPVSKAPSRPKNPLVPARPGDPAAGRDVERPTDGAAPRKAAAPRPANNRRVRLTVSRVDPWSAMKVSFLLSVALGIAMVVMVFVLWTILAGMGVFDQINGVVGQVVQDGASKFDIMDFIGLGRVLSLSIVIAVIDVVLITAIATLSAFLYNVSSALVGGVQLTLTDD